MRLVVVAAQIFLEGNVAQQLDALAQGLLLVGLPEKAGIVKAGAQNAFVAVADQSIGIAGRVEHREEMRQQLSVRIFDGKIFLVVAHHRDQHFFGQFEEFGIEAAQDRRRKLGQIDDGREQRLIFAPARSGDGASRGVKRLADYLFALARAKNLGAAQGLNVGAGFGE